MLTVPDVILVGTAYQNIYSATGITVGTAVRLQNKSSGTVQVQIIASQPLSNSPNGFIVGPLEYFDVPASVAGLWVIGKGNLAVA